jgi:hypothetical protein
MKYKSEEGIIYLQRMGNPLKIKHLFFIAGIIMLLFNSCSKNKGCTDKSSINYDPAATKNSGCVYKGSVVLWFNQASSSHMSNHGISGINIYVDRILIGALNANDYCDTTPACSQPHSITVEKDLGASSSKIFDIEVMDNIGNSIWVSKKTWISNTCSPVQISY